MERQYTCKECQDIGLLWQPGTPESQVAPDEYVSTRASKERTAADIYKDMLPCPHCEPGARIAQEFKYQREDHKPESAADARRRMGWNRESSIEGRRGFESMRDVLRQDGTGRIWGPAIDPTTGRKQ